MKADELLRQYAAGERYFRGVSLQGIYLRGVSLSGADLRWVDLSRASLMDVDLSQANLHGANLSSSNLLMANLNQACLSQANFQQAILIKADLSETVLHTTNFQRANLCLANLMGASDISTANLQKAILNGATMPDGTVFGKRSWWFRLQGVFERLNRNAICLQQRNAIATEKERLQLTHFNWKSNPGSEGSFDRWHRP
ncbi:pentapeptide repeat-containing protein [Allocoleopsis franciscana]|uniref:Putative low-complexity protein n=1 Tax=Allocoleopsis franciscana PCC 7113 TaxID=1173027 RepID=K9WGA0_9CYAN|nr:pentapeptide repeat-containing protein [Allocoleopsis franciscana]AFZ18804.1 putative low-complexity protein [Allocoleopsis franciscana PCC 7113]